MNNDISCEDIMDSIDATSASAALAASLLLPPPACEGLGLERTAAAPAGLRQPSLHTKEIFGAHSGLGLNERRLRTSKARLGKRPGTS